MLYHATNTQGRYSDLNLNPIMLDIVSGSDIEMMCVMMIFNLIHGHTKLWMIGNIVGQEMFKIRSRILCITIIIIYSNGLI